MGDVVSTAKTYGDELVFDQIKYCCTVAKSTYMMSEHGQDFDGMRNFLEKYIYFFLMIPLNYKCSKDAKTGLGLVRECLVQILSHYLETKVDGQSSCTPKRYIFILYI